MSSKTKSAKENKKVVNKTTKNTSVANNKKRNKSKCMNECLYGGTCKKLCDNDSCVYCEKRSFAASTKVDFWSKLNEKRPREILLGSKTIVYFDCKECSHTFQCVAYELAINCWCPYCNGQKLCDDKKCKFCWENSFISHEKAKYWSNLNNESPRMYRKHSEKLVYFDCNICDHTFQTDPASVVRERWCGYCSNTILCTDNACKTCFIKSFASNPKSIYWVHENNGDMTPRKVFKNSDKKFCFKCNVCSHTFYQSLNGISRNYWCIFCARLRLCDDEKCIWCYDKSFISCKKSQYWSHKNILKPRQIFKHTHRKYIFDCSLCGSEYISTPHMVSSGIWCPCTKNKTETKLKKWLIDNNFNISTQGKFDWCKNPETNHYFPFDFIIENSKIIIELDGNQHFKQIANWQSPEIVQKRDIYKMNKALEHDYTIIRILQEDVFSDKNDWEQRLTKCLNTCIENFENAEYSPTYYFLCTNDEYTDHIKLLDESKNNPVADYDTEIEIQNESISTSSSDFNSELESDDTINKIAFNITIKSKPNTQTNSKKNVKVIKQMSNPILIQK